MMQTRWTLLAACMVWIAAAGTTITARAQPTATGELPLTERFIYTNTMMGTDFWVVVPTNDHAAQPGQELSIMISGPVRTTATVRAENREATYQVPRILQSSRGETSWDWEVTLADTVLPKAVHITSQDPVSVSLLSGKQFTGEATMVLPTSEWDTSYIVTTYYDFNETRPWAGGFCVVAGTDATVVTISGRGQVVMNAGDVYCVQGDGTTRGVFDLTGTVVTASAPIGLVNYHQRTTVPSALVNGTGRDHLLEMGTPVSAWGQRYVTVSHHRSGAGAGNGIGTGDVFRVVASEPDTRWTVTHYSASTNEILTSEAGVIATAGGVAEIGNVTTPTELFDGVTVWEADHPIQVMQLAASASWDGDDLLDPMLHNVVPLDRAAHAMPIHHSADGRFAARRIYVVVQVDPEVVAVGKLSGDSSIIHALQAITVGDPIRSVATPLWSHPNTSRGSLLEHHLGDGLFWAELEFGPTDDVPTIIAGDSRVRITGYVAGYAFNGTYAAAAGGLHSRAVQSGTIDTAAPVVRIAGFDGGLVTFTCTENTNLPASDGLPRQVDVGIVHVGVVGVPQNMELVHDSVMIVQDGRVTERVVLARRIDTLQMASLSLAVVDRAGNVHYVDYAYTPPKRPRYTVSNIRTIGSAAVGYTICSVVNPHLRIQGDTSVTVTAVRVDSNQAVFAIDTVSASRWAFPVVLEPSRTVPLTCLCATPVRLGADTGVVTVESDAAGSVRTFTVQVIGTEPTSVTQEDALRTGQATAVYDGSSIVVRWPKDLEVQRFTVHDLGGSTLLQGALPAGHESVLSISAATLARGLYHVRLIGDASVATISVVVE